MMQGAMSLDAAAKATPAARWRATGLALAVVLAWVLLWYQDTVAAMVGIWLRSDTFMHCFLIPPIVLWLVWRQRSEWLPMQPEADWRTPILMALVAFAWLLGELAAVNAVTQLALVGLLVLTVPALCGWRVAGSIALPLAFLFFSVPIGEFIMPRMMEWTADFTVFALRLSGIPVYREGLQFVLPSGNWSVVEACSGIRYLIASITVGTLFAYLNFHSLKRRAAFIVLAILVPIVANWLRAYGIVMLGHLSGNQLAVGVDHLIYGWLFFGVVILLMFVIGGRWADAAPLAPRAAALSNLGPAAPRAPWIAMVAIMLTTALPPLALVLMEGRAEGIPVQLRVPNQTDSPWRPTGRPLTDWRPAFQNPSTELRTGYVGPQGSVGLYVGYYRHQGHARKLVSSENMLVRSKDAAWAQVDKGSAEIVFNGRPVRAGTAELRGASVGAGGAENRLVVWQLYWVNESLTADDYLAKARIAFLRLLGQADDSAVIILYAPKDQPGGGQAALQSFVQTSAAAVETELRRAKGPP
jgi:exosortase A